MKLPYDSIVSSLTLTAEKLPYKTACVFFNDKEEIKITYGELVQRAQAIAAIIQNCAKPNDRVILLYPSGLDFITAFFGCQFAGVIAVPVYPPQNQELVLNLQKIIENAEPTLCLSTREISNKIKKLNIAKNIQNIPLLNTLVRKFAGEKLTKMIDLSAWDFDQLRWITTDDIESCHANEWQPIIIRPDAIAMLQYTSGSTAFPKGVMLTHANLIANLELNRKDAQVNDNDCGVNWLPLYHNIGFLICILQPIYSRIPAHLMSPLAFLEKPIRWLNAISHYRGSICGAPTFAYDLCTRSIRENEKIHLDLSSWKIAFCGGEPVRYHTIERFYEAFAACGLQKKAFYAAYGLTEATVYVVGSDRNQEIDTIHVNRELLSVNQIVISDVRDAKTQTLVGYRNNEKHIKIVNPETLQICKENEIGEIWINNASIGKGYWREPQETCVIFQNYLGSNEGPFLRTGDLGFIHKNIIYLTGRLKNLIIIRGKNYYPQDLEYQVIESHPLLQSSQSVAFGIEENGTEKLAILIECSLITEEIANKLCLNINQIIAAYFSIQAHAIGFVPENTFKKTGSGKLRRTFIAKEYAENKLPIFFHWENTFTDTFCTNNQLNNNSFLEKLDHGSLNEKYDLLKKSLKEMICDILKNPLNEYIDEQTGFFALGMDSLMVIDFKNRLQNALGNRIQLPPTFMFDYPSINELSKKLVELLNSPSKELLIKFDKNVSQEDNIEQTILNMSEEELLKKIESL